MQADDQKGTGQCAAGLGHPSHAAAQAGGNPKGEVMVKAVLLAEGGEHRLGTGIPLHEESIGVFQVVSACGFVAQGWQ